MTSAKKQRLISLDLFRGLTIAAMILVNTPGDSRHTYRPLRHAEWDAITPTDFVFPFFMFIVGVALAAALRPYLRLASEDQPKARTAVLYARLARRATVLILIGLVLNLFPELNVDTWRIPGVLQRIGVCFFLAALLLLHVPERWQWGVGAAILVGYAGVLHLVGAPGVTAGQLEPTANLPRWVDIAAFTPAHVFRYWPTEPEGLLSTPAALVSTLLGCWVGLQLVGRPVSRRVGLQLVATGVAGTLIGWAWSLVLPMVKMIWTPSFVLFTGGWAMIMLGACYLYTDVRRAGRWIWVIEVFGRNAILAYILSEFGAIILQSIEIAGAPFPRFATEQIAAIGGGAAISRELASLLYASVFTMLIWSLLYFPFHRRWFVRV
jgi:predicted acyltransferase